jgi:hypothetical protein
MWLRKSSFNGEYTKWIKLANTLKLRCAMHLSLVKPDLAKKEAEEAVDPANEDRVKYSLAVI